MDDEDDDGDDGDNDLMIMMTVMTRTNLGTSLLPARSLAVGLLVLVAVDFFTGVLLNVGTLHDHHCVNRRCSSQDHERD